MKKRKKPILVIEDDIDLCNSILFTLDRSGYSPTGASEMRAAMFKIKNEKYSCILLDMRLGPESGADLVDFIRERKDTGNTSTPIVVISGNLDRELVERLLGRIQGALVKPFDMSALLEMVRKNTE
jgi:DNA-binding response OmpR family regulator